MGKKNSYRINCNISLSLEEIAREKAYNMGLIKGGKGMVSSYISMLIMDDLKDKPVYPYKIINYNDLKRINITFPEELMNDVRDRAGALGFIRNDEGNVSEYINFLLSQNL